MRTPHRRRNTYTDVISGIRAASDIYIADCIARNLSAHTITINKRVLENLAVYLDDTRLQNITSTHIGGFFADKSKNLKPSSIARYYDTLQAFFGYLRNNGHILQDPIKSVSKPKFSDIVIQPLSQIEVEALLATTSGNTFLNVRNRLIILILVDCGLRATELTDLELDDINWDNQYLQVRHGKGDKSRRVPFGNAVAALLRVYIARRGGVESSSVIVNCYGQSTDRMRISDIVDNAAKTAKINRKHVGPHLLRHTFAVSYLRAGGDVFSLQKILGHSNLTMSRHYAELADSDVMTKHRACSPGDRLTMPAQEKGKHKIK